MQDSKTWFAISNHLSGEETPEEKEVFLKWLQEAKQNQELFNKLTIVWNQPWREPEPSSFLQKFTWQKIKEFIGKQALGNLVGYIIGLSVTHSFTHYFRERRGINNLFGLAGRKKVVVNDIPIWMQWTISVVVGFIVLEFINYSIQTKKHVLIWNYLKNSPLRRK
jgi:hypothetical protein